MRTALRTSPSVGEGRLVDVELGLSETASGDGAAGIADLLESRLGRGELVDQGAQRVVLAGGELVNERLEDERRVAGPGVEIVRVRRARTRNNDSRLKPKRSAVSASDDVEGSAGAQAAYAHPGALRLRSTGPDVR